MVLRLSRAARLAGLAFLLALVLGTVTSQSEAQAKFSTGWTSVSASANKMLFYNANSGLAVTAHCSYYYGCQQYNTYHMSTGWTHIAAFAQYVDNYGYPPFRLFYNASTGQAVTAMIDWQSNVVQLKTFWLSTGWTHIVGGHNGSIFFYNSRTGTGVTGTIDQAGVLHQAHTYGMSPGWTQIAITDNNALLFYNSKTGLGVTADLYAPDGTVTQRETYHFSTGWTHIAGAGNANGVMFYNADTGQGVLASIEPGGTVTQHGSYSFSPGWTHVLGSANDSLFFYNSSNGEGAMGSVLDDQFTQTHTFV